MKIKNLAIGAIAGLLAFGLLAFSGCADSKKPEDVIREGLTHELDGIKNATDDMYESLLDDLDSSGLESYGIDAKEFAQAYLDGFDYAINDITVDGDTATVNLTLTCKNFSEFFENAEKAALNLFMAGNVLSMTEDEINAKLGEAMMQAIEDTAVTETEPFDIEYKLNGKTWEPSADASSAVSAAMFGY